MLNEDEKAAHERHIAKLQAQNAEAQLKEIEEMGVKPSDGLRLSVSAFRAQATEEHRADERHADRMRAAFDVVRSATEVVDALDPWAETDEGEPFRREPLADGDPHLEVVDLTVRILAGNVLMLALDVRREYAEAGVEGPETDRLDALIEALSAVDEPSPDGAATGGGL